MHENLGIKSISYAISAVLGVPLYLGMLEANMGVKNAILETLKYPLIDTENNESSGQRYLEAQSLVVGNNRRLLP